MLVNGHHANGKRRVGSIYARESPNSGHATPLLEFPSNLDDYTASFLVAFAHPTLQLQILRRNALSLMSTKTYRALGGGD